MSVCALVGAQFGSEGKGACAYELRNDYDVHIRTGAPNAGHTYYHEGRKWVSRSVPVGWTNKNASLVIGPGALIDLDLLTEEIAEIEKAGYEVKNRLYVDRNAALIDPSRHRDFEGGVHGYAHAAIGSTGEGVGPARMAKIARGTFNMAVGPAWALIDHVKDREKDVGEVAHIADTVHIVNAWIHNRARILLEGTQGSGLSLVHGSWPYVTSTDTNAAQLLVDAGISPRLLTRVVLVARTFPIRVAGNSGPLPNETDWETVGVPPETTTVTKKVRRVGRWDTETVRRAIMLNGPATLALTFGDYVDPTIRGATKESVIRESFLGKWIRQLERELLTAVVMVGTGPDTMVRLS